MSARRAMLVTIQRCSACKADHPVTVTPRRPAEGEPAGLNGVFTCPEKNVEIKVAAGYIPWEDMPPPPTIDGRIKKAVLRLQVSGLPGLEADPLKHEAQIGGLVMLLMETKVIDSMEEFLYYASLAQMQMLEAKVAQVEQPARIIDIGGRKLS